MGHNAWILSHMSSEYWGVYKHRQWGISAITAHVSICKNHRSTKHAIGTKHNALRG